MKRTFVTPQLLINQTVFVPIAIENTEATRRIQFHSCETEVFFFSHNFPAFSDISIFRGENAWNILISLQVYQYTGYLALSHCENCNQYFMRFLLIKYANLRGENSDLFRFSLTERLFNLLEIVKIIYKLKRLMKTNNVCKVISVFEKSRPEVEFVFIRWVNALHADTHITRVSTHTHSIHFIWYTFIPSRCCL